jgi:two-component system chemotaxis response regulator CheY
VRSNFSSRAAEERGSESKERCDMSKAILTVDDSASMRQMLAFILKGAGYEVVQATSPDEAIAMALERSFDLVLTDQNMAGGDGISLIGALRKLPAYASTPIIMLTTESSDEMKAKGRAAGATGWMVKPFDPNRLLEIVRKFAG